MRGGGSLSSLHFCLQDAPSQPPRALLSLQSRPTRIIVPTSGNTLADARPRAVPEATHPGRMLFGGDVHERPESVVAIMFAPALVGRRARRARRRREALGPRGAVL